jgi:hypothetical protein
MTVCNILNTLPIGNDTAVVVEGSRDLFQIGTGVLDENGKPYVVLSVGMEEYFNPEDMMNKSSLLLEGNFASKRLFV